MISLRGRSVQYAVRLSQPFILMERVGTKPAQVRDALDGHGAKVDVRTALGNLAIAGQTVARAHLHDVATLIWAAATS